MAEHHRLDKREGIKKENSEAQKWRQKRQAESRGEGQQREDKLECSGSGKVAETSEVTCKTEDRGLQHSSYVAGKDLFFFFQRLAGRLPVSLISLSDLHMLLEVAKTSPLLCSQRLLVSQSSNLIGPKGIPDIKISNESLVPNTSSPVSPLSRDRKRLMCRVVATNTFKSLT